MPYVHTTEKKLRRLVLPFFLTPWEKISKQNYSLENTTLNSDVKEWFSKMERERNAGFELIKIGEPGDGSYMIPNDLEDINHCVSLGYGGIMTFEKHLADLGVKSFIVDKEVPSDNSQYFHFVDKYIGVTSDNEENTVSMEDLLVKYVDKGRATLSDLILQMDIELDEWLVLNSLTPEIIRRFRILVVELHSLHLLKNRWIYANIMNPVIDKLRKSHVVANLEVNQASGMWSLNQIDWFPDTVEVTFHRSDRRLNTKSLMR